MIEKMLAKAEVRLGVDYLEHKDELDALAEKVVYTGPIDAYYGYQFGELEYRSVSFETEVLDQPNYQGNAVVNYTEYEVPYTRIIEHKHFEFGTQDMTVISREYPAAWKKGDEPYYPVNNEKNNMLYHSYGYAPCRSRSSSGYERRVNLGCTFCENIVIYCSILYKKKSEA